jgi:5,10-methylenetetrahydrofolate reductase
MLTTERSWVDIAEVNPPALPDRGHLLLDGAWRYILVTDNVFGTIRSSPYAHAARIAHDLPGVHPTVVVSTRDRNILAIESEVRGALGNGVDSFLVVIGDTVPAVEHLSDHLVIVEHMRNLQSSTPAFEVGMPTRFSHAQFRRRIDRGAQFFVAGPVTDPDTVEEQVASLRLDSGDPPVFLMLIPPFSPSWLERVEAFGAVPASDRFRGRVAAVPEDGRRSFAWDQAAAVAERARISGCAGTVLMGLKRETVMTEAATEWWSRFPERRP